MLFLSDDQLRNLMNVDEAIAAIHAAFSRGFSSLHMPVRTSLPLGDGVLLTMPCYDSALKIAGVKLVSVSEKAGVNAVYEMFDEAGWAVARLEANYLTDLRTAATSAVATDLLARRDAETLGVFGSGRQAEAHFAVLPRVRGFKRFLVCGSGRSDLKQFRRKMQTDHGIEVEPVTADVGASESDVICTCTTATEPLFDGRWVKPGTHLNLVGAFQPHTREVDDETVRRARVVVDTYDGAMAEAGDLLIPMEAGLIDRSHVIADLHEIASGKKTARTSRNDITLFKSLGCAMEDLIVAYAAFTQVTSARPNASEAQPLKNSE